MGDSNTVANHTTLSDAMTDNTTVGDAMTDTNKAVGKAAVPS